MELDRRSDLSRHLMKYDLRDVQEMLDSVGSAMYAAFGDEQFKKAANAGHDMARSFADKLTDELEHEGWLLAMGMASMDLVTSFIIGFEHILDTAELYEGEE